MRKRNGPNRQGFTLVEMLVVVAIIGVLAAILVPTLYLALAQGKDTVIAMDINQLNNAVESYKQKYQDYPPDCSNLQVVQRHLRKAFPKFQDTWANTNMLRPDGTPALDSGGNPADPANLDPSEALVFWLGMLRNDKRNPLNGNGKLSKDYDFDLKRLVDVDGDGWYSYVPPEGEDEPYIYFDSRTYTVANYTDSAGTLLLLPYTSKPSAAAAANWANPTKHQIISAGQDGDYGAVVAATYKIFPDPTTMTEEDLDNIANFSDGKTFEDHME